MDTFLTTPLHYSADQSLLPFRMYFLLLFAVVSGTLFGHTEYCCSVYCHFYYPDFQLTVISNYCYYGLLQTKMKLHYRFYSAAYFKRNRSCTSGIEVVVNYAYCLLQSFLITLPLAKLKSISRAVFSTPPHLTFPTVYLPEIFRTHNMMLICPYYDSIYLHTFGLSPKRHA
jgi:hypothetical protein